MSLAREIASLKQHDKTANQIRNTSITDNDTDKEDDAARDQIEENEDQDELPKLWYGRD